MKYVLTWLLGAILGVAAAAMVLYHSPLSGTREHARASIEDDWTLEYAFPTDSTIVLTHSGQLGLPHVPQDVATLWEAGIDRMVLNVVMLAHGDGEHAFASRISVPSADTDLLLNGVIVEDHWLVTVPGQGTLFVEAQSNVWPLLKDTFIPVTYLQREWRGPARYAVTAGPGPRGDAEVYGVSGRFEGLRGAAREIYDLKRFSAARGIEALDGALVVELDEPIPAEAQAAGAGVAGR